MALEVAFDVLIDNAMKNYHNDSLAPYVRAQSLITAYFADAFSPTPLIEDKWFDLEEKVATNATSLFQAYLNHQIQTQQTSFSPGGFIEWVQQTFNSDFKMHMPRIHGVDEEISPVLSYLLTLHGAGLMGALLIDEVMFQTIGKTMNGDPSAIEPPMVQFLMNQFGEAVFVVDADGDIQMDTPLLAGYTTKARRKMVGWMPSREEASSMADVLMQLADPVGMSAVNMEASLKNTLRALADGEHPQFEAPLPSVWLKLLQPSRVTEQVVLVG